MPKSLPSYSEAFETAIPYLYPLDCPKVNRILRPLRAKLAALQRDLHSAPAAFSSTATLADPDENRIEQRTRRNPKLLSPPRHHSKFKYGNRRLRPALELSAPIFFSSLPADPASSTLGISVTNSTLRASSKLTTPLRRHTNSLRDLVKDTVERLWWGPLRENWAFEGGNTKVSSHQILKQRVPSLVQLASIAIGKQVEDYKVLNEGIDDIDNLYEEIPPHWRRYVLVEHYIQLCIQQVPLVDMLDPIVDICVNMRADHQALSLLRHIIVNRLANSLSIDLYWIYHAAQSISKTDDVVQTLCDHLTLDLAKRQSFSQFVSSVPTRHSVQLIRKAAHQIACELNSRQDSASINLDQQNQQHSRNQHRQNLMVQRSRLASWAKLLMTGSISATYRRNLSIDATSVDSNDPLIQASNDVIVMMAKDTADVATKLPELMSDVALSLCLHALYLEASYQEVSASHADQLLATGSATLQLLSQIRTLIEARTDMNSLSNHSDSFKGENKTSFMKNSYDKHVSHQYVMPLDLLFGSYRTLPHLLDLVRTLDRYEMYDVCGYLLTKMINEYEILRREQGFREKRGGIAAGTEYDRNEDPVGMDTSGRAVVMNPRELEEYLMEVERKAVMKESGGCGKWEYEPVLDSWVLKSPCAVPKSLASSKTLCYQADMETATTGNAETQSKQTETLTRLSSPLAIRFTNVDADPSAISNTSKPSPFVVVQRRINGRLGLTWNDEEEEDRNDDDYLPTPIKKRFSASSRIEPCGWTTTKMILDNSVSETTSTSSSPTWPSDEEVRVEINSIRRSPRRLNRSCTIKRTVLPSWMDNDESDKLLFTHPSTKNLLLDINKQARRVPFVEIHLHGHRRNEYVRKDDVNCDLKRAANIAKEKYKPRPKPQVGENNGDSVGTSSQIYTINVITSSTLRKTRNYTDCDSAKEIIANKPISNQDELVGKRRRSNYDKRISGYFERDNLLGLTVGEALPETNDIDDLAM